MEVTLAQIPYADKKKFYADLAREIEAFADPYWLTALANASASLKQHLPDLNWAGFYLVREGGLALGPFQGLPACTRIALGKGVCGTAAAEKRTIVVDDVEQFPGHIACDSASRSEVVVPLIIQGIVRGVLDLDSPRLARFDGQDARGLELVVATLIKFNEWPAEF